jgi:hypothetical protein
MQRVPHDFLVDIDEPRTRFSTAGNDDLTARSGGRRLRSVWRRTWKPTARVIPARAHASRMGRNCSARFQPARRHVAVTRRDSDRPSGARDDLGRASCVELRGQHDPGEFPKADEFRSESFCRSGAQKKQAAVLEAAFP